MLGIKKSQNEHGYSFIISTEQGKFEISFSGNFDLYWRNIYCENSLHKPDYKTFSITKENYYVYSLFEKLYKDIKNCNVFQMSEDDLFFSDDVERNEEEKREIQYFNSILEQTEKYNPQRLFRNGAVEWHSDDSAYDHASIVKIEKKEDIFMITIGKDPVRFSSTGSRYTPFNNLFMQMYEGLLEYDPSFLQLHNNEEVLYQKKLGKEQ